MSDILNRGVEDLLDVVRIQMKGRDIPITRRFIEHRGAIGAL